MMRILMKNLNRSQPHVLHQTIRSRGYHSSRDVQAVETNLLIYNALLPDSKSTHAQPRVH